MALDPDSLFIGFIGGIFAALLVLMAVMFFGDSDPGGPL